MTRRCFMVYPLPSVADESFLQLLFDGGVRRSAFAGFGKRRFALVELQGDTQAEAVWRAIGPALPNSVATTAAAAETHGGGSVNLDEDCTLAELFAAHNAATIAAAAAPNVDGAAGQSCMSFFGRLRFRGTPLQVVPSPVTIEELYSCGGQVPQPRPTAAGDQEGPRDKRSHAQKRLRPSGAEDAAGHAAQTVEREPKRSAAAASSRDACRRCGSTTHFTRQCTADPSSEESTSAAPAIAVESAAATDSCVAVDTATEGTSRLQQSHRRGAKNEFPQNCCQKCGSSAHFTRHCDGGNAADEAPRPQELPVPVSVADHGERSKPLALQQEHSKPQPKQQQQQQQRQQHHQLQQDRPQRPAVVRTSKDQCKHCGSDLHLSRHCPSNVEGDKVAACWMADPRDVSLSVVEALRRLPQPLLFAHPAYAVAAIPCGDAAPHRHANDSRQTKRTVPAVGACPMKAPPFSSRQKEAAVAVKPMARQLFDHVRRQWAEGNGELSPQSSNKRRRCRAKGARVLITSTVTLPSTVPLVTELMSLFLHHRLPCIDRGEKQQQQHDVDSLVRYLQDALGFLLCWSHPAMCFTVTAKVTEPRLSVAADVLHSSPLLVRPWTDNSVLLAMACAPEWSLQELSGSRRIAAWVHRYVTATRLAEHVATTRLQRWQWLEGRLRALMSPADVAVFVRTLCALLLALEVELVAGLGNGDGLVKPRDECRDREGLLLLLGILGERGSHSAGAGTERKRKKKNALHAHHYADYDGADYDDLQEFDARIAATITDRSVADFLSEQPTCVEFVAPPGSGSSATRSQSSHTQVRRLCGVADELYHFLSEWIRLTTNAALSQLAAQFAPAYSSSSTSKLLPRFTVLVGRAVQSSGGATARALPLSFLPVNLLSDLLLEAQLRQAVRNDDVAPLFCDAANATAARSSISGGDGGARRMSGTRCLFEIPLWSDDEDDDGNDIVAQSSWFTDLMVNGAVRCLDDSPARWQKRALTQVRKVLDASRASRQRSEFSFLRVALGGANEPLLLLLRHAQCEVRYALSPWHVFPSLPSDISERRHEEGLLQLRECLDPRLLQQKGLVDGSPIWTTLEAEYIDQLQRRYRRLFWRARVALECDVEDTMVGLHLVAAPVHLQLPSAAEVKRMQLGVEASLSSRLLLRSAEDDRLHVKLPFSLFCARYGPLVAGAKDHKHACRQDRAYVEGVCAALRLPAAGVRLLDDEIGLTMEGLGHLAQLVTRQETQQQQQHERGRQGRETAASEGGGARGGGVFNAHELRSCGDVAPLTLEEWCRMVNETLAPSPVMKGTHSRDADSVVITS